MNLQLPAVPTFDQANAIKFFAVLTAIPRWVVALMASEGFALPPEWKPVWVFFSALSAAGMAVVEGIAFAYVFNAWKRETNENRAGVILTLAVLSGLLFVAMLTPSIVASVTGKTVADVLNTPLLWIWSAVVAASTIAIVASVGYAQKATGNSSTKPQARDEKPTANKQVADDLNELNSIAAQAAQLATQLYTQGQSKTQVARQLNITYPQLPRKLIAQAGQMDAGTVTKALAHVNGHTPLNTN